MEAQEVWQSKLHFAVALFPVEHIAVVWLISAGVLWILKFTVSLLNSNFSSFFHVLFELQKILFVFIVVIIALGFLTFCCI